MIHVINSAGALRYHGRASNQSEQRWLVEQQVKGTSRRCKVGEGHAIMAVTVRFRPKEWLYQIQTELSRRFKHIVA